VLSCPQNESGIRILDADPSIRCDEVCPLHRIPTSTHAPLCECVPSLNVPTLQRFFSGGRFGSRQAGGVQERRMPDPPRPSLYSYSFVSTQAGGVQERLKPAAVLSLLGYTVGLPLTFFMLLVKHRQSILADQALKVAGQGATEATNPYFHIRMQFQELYRCGGGAPHAALPVWKVADELAKRRSLRAG
jgi:hypothetical protein